MQLPGFPAFRFRAFACGFRGETGFRFRILGMSSLVAALLAAAAPPAHAEVHEVRIAQQFGIAYLPLIVMKEKRLLEKHAERLGIGGLQPKWFSFAGGSNMNDALLSGNLDFASGGVPPFVTLWSRTQDSNPVRIASVMSQMPIFLNTTNPKVHSLKDFGQQDKIALPAVRTSNQAVVLTMAAEAQYGAEEAKRINRLTVSMSHPDATAALLNGNISAHFASPPFQYQQLRDERVRTVLSSKDVLGPFTFSVAWTHVKFREENPRTYEAFTSAMAEAIEFIRSDKPGAAALYANAAGSSESAEELLAILSDPDVEFTTTPQSVQRYASYMHEIGLIKRRPGKWQELFFENVHDLPGS